MPENLVDQFKGITSGDVEIGEYIKYLAKNGIYVKTEEDIAKVKDFLGKGKKNGKPTNICAPSKPELVGDRLALYGSAVEGEDARKIINNIKENTAKNKKNQYNNNGFRGNRHGFGRR